ncbi:MAG: GtrA family protein [Azospirillum sp.]|nr:GtrA family protein [Azospirillum sp.]
MYARVTATRLGRLGVQFCKFGLVGVVGLGVDTAVLYAALGLGLDPYSGRLVSFLAAATTTWVLNRTFTFQGHHQGRKREQWARFLGANAFGALVNYGVYAVLVATSATVAAEPFLGVAAGSLAGMGFNFAASKKLVFERTA